MSFINCLFGHEHNIIVSYATSSTTNSLLMAHFWIENLEKGLMNIAKGELIFVFSFVEFYIKKYSDSIRAGLYF